MTEHTSSESSRTVARDPKNEKITFLHIVIKLRGTSRMHIAITTTFGNFQG